MRRAAIMIRSPQPIKDTPQAFPKVSLYMRQTRNVTVNGKQTAIRGATDTAVRSLSPTLSFLIQCSWFGSCLLCYATL